MLGSRMIVIRRLIILLMFFAGAPCNSEEPKEKFGIGLAPELVQPGANQTVTAIWLIYANTRASYAEKHREKIVMDERGVVPSFDDELAARKEAVRFYKHMKTKKPEFNEAYWEGVAKASDAGFIEEYVWTFLSRPGWPDADKPKRLPEFKAYQERELRGHQGVTLATIGKSPR